MKLPPVTPKGVLNELRKQPSVALRIARGWVLVGAIVASFAVLWAFWPALTGEPMINGNTGERMTPSEVFFAAAQLAAAGLLFVAAGIVLRRWIVGPS